MIVVDDGSTDETLSAARSFLVAHPQALTVLSTANAGPAAARNTDVEAASGDWLLFFDDDTLLAPGFAADVRRLLQAPPADFIGLADLPLPHDSYLAKSLRYLELASRRTIERLYAFKCVALWRRSQFQALGGFATDRGYYQQEDTDLVDRALRSGLKAVYLTAPTYPRTNRPNPLPAKRNGGSKHRGEVAHTAAGQSLSALTRQLTS